MKNRYRSAKAVLCIAMVSASLPTRSDAAIVYTSSSNTSLSFFDGNISTSDLIHEGAASFGSYSLSDPASFTTQNGFIDGAPTEAQDVIYWNNPAPHTMTVLLTGSATGYDLTQITSIYGWQDTRTVYSAQHYDVLVSTVGSSSYSLLLSVDYDPFASNGEGSSQVVVTENSTGILASGVDAIRFVMRGDSSNPNVVGVIREIDVFGSVTSVPEPSSMILLGLGSLLSVYRRRR